MPSVDSHNIVVSARHLSCKGLVWVLELVVVVVSFVWLCAVVHVCTLVHPGYGRTRVCGYTLVYSSGDINSRFLCQCLGDICVCFPRCI